MADGNLSVMRVLEARRRTDIIQQSEAAPLEVPDKILGDQKGKARWGSELGWSSGHAYARVMVGVEITCGSDPKRMINALDHCKELVNMILVEEVPKIKQLCSALNEEG